MALKRFETMCLVGTLMRFNEVLPAMGKDGWALRSIVVTGAAFAWLQREIGDGQELSAEAWACWVDAQGAGKNDAEPLRRLKPDNRSAG